MAGDPPESHGVRGDGRGTRRAAACLPATRYGWDGNLRLLGDWWQTVTSTTAPNLDESRQRVAERDVHALARARFGRADPRRGRRRRSCSLLTAIVIAGRGSLPAPEALEGSLLLLLIPLLSPQGWDYVFLIGTPAVMLLINDAAALPRGLRIATIAAIAVVALSIYDVVGRDGYSLFMSCRVITVCVVIEVAALVTLRFRRAA